MTTTMIRRLPDGKWQLTQKHDTLASLMAAIDAMADLGEQVAVELPKVEPPWCFVFRVGDEGLLNDGRPYAIKSVNHRAVPYPLRGIVGGYDMSWTSDGRYNVDGSSPDLNLRPPTKRGPAV